MLKVYLDVLILENVVLNYLILQLTDKLLKAGTSRFRLFAGALTGALYVGLLVIMPGIHAYYTVAGKFLLSLLIVAISFSPEKIINFVKTLAVFYVSTFIFAGAAFAFVYFNGSGGFVRNGIVYFFGGSKWTVIFLSVITVGIIVRIIMDIWQTRQYKDNLLVPLKICFESRSVILQALVDTGNSLNDPLSKLPVIVVEYKALCQLFPDDIKTIFDKEMENDLDCVTKIISNSSWFSRFRLIPFCSLGKENGMLIGFKPDFILIGEADSSKNICDVVVGVYNRTLSKNNTYKALLGPEFITDTN